MLPHNPNTALLSIYAGAGGVDAQDWAGMLLRMYNRLAQKRGWKFLILDESRGEQGGVKSIACEVNGPNVYAILQGESGVHRLVRISPFSAKKLRHTSFALVEILPELTAQALHVNAQDLRVDTYRSGGKGGQNVNKVETAVRITHIPSGIAVAVQTERSQSQNKEKAMSMLMARLMQRMEAQRVSDIAALKPEMKAGSIEWGSQIRSYVLHPYQMVKDHRSGKKSSQPERVLEGDLDDFLATP
ncbi:MAG: peptide chain release factor-like protein [Patescibacteria group bacterium]